MMHSIIIIHQRYIKQILYNIILICNVYNPYIIIGLIIILYARNLYGNCEQAKSRSVVHALASVDD